MWSTKLWAHSTLTLNCVLNSKYDKLIINSHNKLEIAKQEYIDIFIDDSIRNCEMVSSGDIKTYMEDLGVRLYDRVDWSPKEELEVLAWRKV